MIWWTIFIALSALSIAAALQFVPAEHRRNYRRCRKDRAYWLSILFSSSIWIVAAIQHAVARGACPNWLRLTGVALFVAGETLAIWAWRVNSLFVPKIIFVPLHLRVTDRPYSRLRHPGYAGMALAATGIFFLLGQWWAFFPTLAYQCLLYHRITVEDRALSTQKSS